MALTGVPTPPPQPTSAPNVVRFRLNGTLYRVGGFYKLVASPRSGGSAVPPEIIRLERTELLDDVVAAVGDGIDSNVLTARLCADHPDLDATEVSDFLGELCVAQLLYAGLREGPPAMGQQAYRPTHTQSDRWASVAPSGTARAAEGVARAIHEDLCALSPLLRSEPAPWLARFRTQFAEKFIGQTRSLLLTLDEEVGVPLDSVGASLRAALASPILAGLPVSDRPQPPDARPCSALLLRRLEEWWSGERSDLRLSDTDVALMTGGAKGAPPSSFTVVGTILGANAQGVGEAPLFCLDRITPGHADGVPGPRHPLRVPSSVQEEPAPNARPLGPGAVPAEVWTSEDAWASAGRPFSPFRIILSGEGSASPDALPLSDLCVRVDGHQVLLFSRRWKTEVSPRFSHWGQTPAGWEHVVRFLLAIAGQDALDWSFDWKGMEQLASLPRVVFRRLVLSRARWRLSRTELGGLRETPEGERHAALARLRHRRGLARWLAISGDPSRTAFDLDDFAAREALGRRMLERETVLLEEHPEATDHRATGQWDIQQVALPFVAAQSDPLPSRRLPLPLETPLRTVYPGADCLYVKIYGADGALEHFLCGILPQVLDGLAGRAKPLRWMFMRYADPNTHLRLRFFAVSPSLREELLERLGAGARTLGDGVLDRIQVDTYQRELERYGGVEGMPIVEEIFCADSAAVLQGLRSCRSSEQEERWFLGYHGMQRMLRVLERSSRARREILGSAKRHLWEHLQFGEEVERFLATRSGAAITQLEKRVVGLGTGGKEQMSRAFDARDAQLRQAGQRLRELEAGGRLDISRADIVESLLHLHSNRVFASAGFLFEAVLYDALLRAEDSRSDGREQ